MEGLPGAGYAIGMMGLIYLFSSKRLCMLQPLIPLLSVALCFYFGLRLWDYFVFDLYQIASFRSMTMVIRSGSAVPAFSFAMYATAAIYAGLVCAAASWRGTPKAVFEQYRPEVNADAFFVFILALIVIQIALNGAFSDLIVSAGLVVKILSQVTSHESLLPVAATVFARLNGWKPNAQLFVFLGGIVISRMLGGSRSAPVDIAEIMLAWAIIPGNWNQTFRLSKGTILAGILLIAGSLAGFAAATAIRMVHYDISNTQLFGSANSDDIWNIAQIAYSQIAYRIGTNFDTLLFVFSNYYDHNYANAHVNLETVWQTTLRRVFGVPMNPQLNFDEFELAALVGSRGSWINGALLPTSYSWGLFAYFYQLFASWAVPVLFLVFFGIGKVFIRLQRFTPSLGRDFAMFWIAHAMELLVAVFGFSNLLYRGRVALISFAVIVVILNVVSVGRGAAYRLAEPQ